MLASVGGGVGVVGNGVGDVGDVFVGGRAGVVQAMPSPAPACDVRVLAT